MVKAAFDLKLRNVTMFERFVNKISQGSYGSCWLWFGQVNKKGYGWMRVRVNGKWSRRPTTHVAWFFAHGAWPKKGLMVCHACDTPGCARPSHLFVGTALDNRQDAIRKGRQAGLSVEQIAFVFANKRRLSQPDLARAVGVTRNSIYKLLRKWRKR